MIVALIASWPGSTGTLWLASLLAMPPWRQRQWTEAGVDEETRKEFAALVDALYRLPGGTWPDGRSCIDDPSRAIRRASCRAGSPAPALRQRHHGPRAGRAQCAGIG